MAYYFVVAVALISCGGIENNDTEWDNVVWDVSPLNIVMYVQDNQGNDLLCSSVANNIIDDNIYVEYQDSIYYLNTSIASAQSEVTFDSGSIDTKAYRAVFTGINLTQYGNDCVLVFGEFDGTEDWDDSFEIYWGDGTKDIISFERDFEWDKDGSPKVVSSALYLNNTKMDDLVIVK